MARIVLPTKQENTDRLNMLQKGFILEVKSDSTMILFIKMDAAVIGKITSGSQISLNYGVDKGFPVVYLLIFDNVKLPLCIHDNELVHSEDYLDYFNSVLFAMRRGSNIIVSLFDLSTCPLMAYEATYSFDFERWKSWMGKSLEAGSSEDTGDFELLLNPLDLDKQSKVISIVNFIDDDGKVVHTHSTDYNRLLIDGNHGYAQEQSVSAILINYFELNRTLFISPKYKDKDEEFTDFVLLFHNTVILIESKNIIGSRNIVKRLSKGLYQLQRAHLEIVQGSICLEDEFLTKELMKRENILRICLVNSDIDLSQYLTTLKKLNGLEGRTIILPTNTFFDSLGNTYNFSEDSFHENYEKRILNFK